ncbi:MAG TPA: DMT family transporter [Chitinophagales bacterium]|nr:DMT family transporter [Chitinophagales bacterium]HNM32319.1 DMT family transporter [Chitinophagales bacterium]
MQLQRKAYLNMHIATFLWGITAILGRVISIQEFPLVWFRVCIVSIAMSFIPKLILQLKQLKRKEIFIVSGIGILLTIHWLLWYGSIKYANASVAVSCIACISFFVSILEPILLKKPFDSSNLFLGIMVIPGILLINQSLELNYKIGFLLGILSAVFAALFTIYNKKYTQHISPSLITFIQMLSGLLFLTVLLPFYMQWQPNNFHFPNQKDFILLLILALGCTVIPYNLFLRTLKVTDAFTTTLINNLEPVYGIVLAAILLGESKELNWKFYVGTAIILSAVFAHAFLTHRRQKLEKIK